MCAPSQKKFGKSKKKYNARTAPRGEQQIEKKQNKSVGIRCNVLFINMLYNTMFVLRRWRRLAHKK